MKTDQSQHSKLERIIKAVYRRNGALSTEPVDPRWKTNVLRQIRSLQVGCHGQLSLMDLFQQAVWRLAPVAGGLAFIMAMWIYKSGLSPDLDIASLALNNPDQFGMFQMFGM